MLQAPSTQRIQFTDTLTRIRQEWRDSTGSSSLIEVEGNVEMLLVDLINGIDLGLDEQRQGWELIYSKKCINSCTR